MFTPTTRRRAIVLALPAVYVAIAAASRGDGEPSTWAAIGAAIAVALLGARAASRDEARSGRILACTAGMSIAIATSALAGRPAWAGLARALGALVAAVVAVQAIGTIEEDPGLGPRAADADAPNGMRARSIARAGAAALVLAWGTAALVFALAWNDATGWGDAAPVVAATAGAIGLFVLGGVALLVAAARRLELSAPPRALACAAAAAVGLVCAIALALGGTLHADAAVAVTSAIASSVVVRMAAVRDVPKLARVGRRALSLTLYGGPVAILAALAISSHSFVASATVFVFCVIALAVGAAARKLEEPFLPVRGLWLDALAEARDAARDREPRAVVAHALSRMRQAAQIGTGATSVASPELWMLYPTRIFTVDAAGYVHEKEGELPAAIFDVAAGEPHATVRTGVLAALEVRRPDLRPLLRWLEERDALFATVIGDSNEPDGLLVVPAGARHEPMTLEEVLAAKRLAEAFVAVCQTTSARERHLGRERDLKARIDALDDELERARHALALDVGRNVLAATRLARPATVGIYSAASRMAFDALERRVAQNAPVVVIVRPGMDPVPYVARAHLGGPRKEMPLVVVDGTSSRDHDPERWKDGRASPLALADRGMLVLVDGAALPRDVQVLVARALAERRAPWERALPLDVTATITATAPLDALVEEGRLAPELFARFEETTPIELPGLRERPEDLRSIVADRLAREGMRVRGRPVGIDAAAFARLVEHPFEAEDAELATIVTRLVAIAEDDVVRARDVDALGLVAPRSSAPWSSSS